MRDKHGKKQDFYLISFIILNFYIVKIGLN